MIRCNRCPNDNTSQMEVYMSNSLICLICGNIFSDPDRQDEDDIEIVPDYLDLFVDAIYMQSTKTH